MKKLFLFFLVSTAVLGCQLVDPCMNKDSFLESFEAFIEKVKALEDVEDMDWANKDAKFEKYIKECYDRHKTDLSLAEKKDFWIKSMAYYHKKYGEGFYTKLSETGDPLAEQVKREIEQTFNSSGEDVLAYIREVYGDDIEDTIDKVVKEVEKFGEELKNLLSK